MKDMKATSERRAAKQAKIKAEYDAKREAAVAAARPGSCYEIRDAVRHTNLQYLWARTPKPHALTGPVDADVNEGCTSFRCTMPAGTEGWIYIQREHTFDKYVWVGDEQYPAADAVVVSTKSYYTWCCMVDTPDGPTLAHAFRTAAK